MDLLPVAPLDVVLASLGCFTRPRSRSFSSLAEVHLPSPVIMDEEGQERFWTGSNRAVRVTSEEPPETVKSEISGDEDITPRDERDVALEVN